MQTINIVEWIEAVQWQLENPKPDFDALEYLRLALPVIDALNTTHACNKRRADVTLRFQSEQKADYFMRAFDAFDNPQPPTPASEEA